MSRSVACLGGIGLIAAIAAPAPAAVYRLQPDGAGDYPHIQAAIDAARSGDTIELADGTYSGTGNRDVDYRGKAVAVRSAGGNPQRCVIDCAGGEWDVPHRGFIFHSGEDTSASLTGIAVINGRAVGQRPPEGAAGAVLCDGASPSLTDCLFTLNRAEIGGAVACLNDARPIIAGCVFRDNTAAQGGGLHCWQSAPLLTDCFFIHNTADRGGGLACYAASPNLRGCTFDRNAAKAGAGAMIEAGSKPLLDGCLLCGNWAALGGGLFCDHSEPGIVRCTFAVNAAGSGGGINWIADTGPVLQNCIIAFSTQGEAVTCENTRDMQLTCCLVYANGDGDWVGCLEGRQEEQGNLWTDPLFVDPGRGDFNLREDSPCRQAAADCDPIGAPNPRRIP